MDSVHRDPGDMPQMIPLHILLVACHETKQDLTSHELDFSQAVLFNSHALVLIHQAS